ncbi:TPA: hypothetical protein N0F65_007013 [Lagenidium giganteum]|uniref:vitamin-K-epoxide reductase (warfarin-sensitive) n=1 Tax=Lagenidium giganteum TaxID=4803 RepID=A0AAV2ZG61_9STRA|nr:TPA: hypothetical protein N0F65_007013 [Lagenidium giganteum]
MTNPSEVGWRLVYCGLAGVAVSAYGAYVEYKKRTLQHNYTAMCDLSSYASCSRVMTSAQGKMLSYYGVVPAGSMLDVSNAALGVLAYGLFVMYPLVRSLPNFQYAYLFAAIISVVISAYLAYVLAFVLRDFCLVCVTSYVINAALLWNSIKLVRALPSKQQAMSEAKKHAKKRQ